MEKEIIRNRIERLREVMRSEHLSAFIFPSTDPHHSEYVPDRWKGREWISGFNGSAGTVVVTLDKAALWTDSRYFLAAEEQLKGTGIEPMRLKVAGTPSIPDWLDQELNAIDGSEVGCDGWVNSYDDVERLRSELRKRHGMTLRINFDPLERIWDDRPQVPGNKVGIHPLKYAGEPVSDKLSRIRRQLRQRHCDGMLLSTLDDIAWTLNLRGTDVHCNPVFVAYLLIASDKATLFVDPRKLTPQVEDYLRKEGVSTAPYDKVTDGLRRYGEYNILMDPATTNAMVAAADMPHCHKMMLPSPVPAMKAIKNATEIEGFRHAMLRDGVAMVKFLKWLKPAVAAGGQTEMSVDAKLTSLRREQELFRDISFDTIAGYGPHGAIVHYEATPESDVPLRPEGLLLLDSGAQYSDGTTDITRTIALGPVSEEERRIYTYVS